MSFRCDRCKTAQPDRARPHRVVVETRKKTNGFGEWQGTEIAREEDLCDECAEYGGVAAILRKTVESHSAKFDTVAKAMEAE